MEIRQDVIELTLSRRGLWQILLKAHQLTEPKDADAEREPLDRDRDALTLRVAAKHRRRSGELRLVVPANGEPDLEPRPNALLIKALTRAYTWKQQVLSGEAESTRAIAVRDGLAESYVRRILHLAFLAPDNAEAVLDGRQPADLELDRLMKGIPLA